MLLADPLPPAYEDLPRRRQATATGLDSATANDQVVVSLTEMLEIEKRIQKADMY